MEEKQIEFVAKHYRHGKFDAGKGWKRLGIAPSGWLRRIRVAAAVAGVVALTAVAAVIYNHYSIPQSPEQPQPVQVAVPTLEAVKVIDFDNAPLPTVIAEIREVYGVEIANVPANAEAYRLSLHYEGNVADLVDAINDILGTEMEVKQ